MHALELASCQKRASSLWAVLKIPQMLLEATPAAQSSVLLALPNELLLEILAQVGPVDQLFLALTCKRLFQVASMKEISIPSAAKHRANQATCSAMLSLLHGVRPLGLGDRPSRVWAPCCDCYRFRPKRKSYWKMVGKRYRTKAHPACDILSAYDKLVESWSHRNSYSYQCPECWCVERIRKYGKPEDCKHC